MWKREVYEALLGEREGELTMGWLLQQAVYVRR